MVRRASRDDQERVKSVVEVLWRLIEMISNAFVVMIEHSDVSMRVLIIDVIINNIMRV